MELQEVKNDYKNLIKGINSTGIETDLFYKLLTNDHTLRLQYKNVFSMSVLDNTLNNSSKNTEYDIIYLTWLKHLVGYWEDKTMLLNLYTNSDLNLSPMDSYKKMNKLVEKIDKRLLILNYSGSNNKVTISEQRVQKKGEDKVYKFVRGYWYKNFVKVRSLSFHLETLDKYKKIDEIFRNNGSGIYNDYDFINKKDCYYFVFNNQKVLIDINITDEDFYKLIIFDIQTGKFKDEYK